MRKSNLFIAGMHNLKRSYKKLTEETRQNSNIFNF